MEQLGMDLLLLHVFSRLELHDLGRARCVCRSWRSGIGSPEFARLWEGRGRACSVLRFRPLTSDGKPRLASFHSEVWYPGARGTSRKIGLNPGPPGRLCVGIAGSSHGLVCGLLAPDGVTDAPRWMYWKPHREWEFVVGNPVINAWRILPPVRVPQRNVLGGIECIHLHVEDDQPEQQGRKQRYHLVTLYRSSLNSQLVYLALHYDSATGKWISAEPFNGDAADGGGIDHAAGACVFGTRNLHRPLHFLAAYHPASMSWSCHKHFVIRDGGGPSGPDKNMSCICGVLGWRDKVIMVTYSSEYLVLSELDARGGVWRAFSSRRYDELYSSGQGRFESIEAGDSVWSIHPQLAGDLLVFTHRFGVGMGPLGVYSPFAYNMELSAWYVYQSPYGFKTVDIESSFTFVPSFLDHLYYFHLVLVNGNSLAASISPRRTGEASGS